MTIEQLKDLDPCEEALDFVGHFGSVAKAWDNCTRGDWMFWLLLLRVGTENMTPRLLEFGDLLISRLSDIPESCDYVERAREAVKNTKIQGLTPAQIRLRTALASFFATPPRAPDGDWLRELDKQAADLRRLIPSADFL